MTLFFYIIARTLCCQHSTHLRTSFMRNPSFWLRIHSFTGALISSLLAYSIPLRCFFSKGKIKKNAASEISKQYIKLQPVGLHREQILGYRIAELQIQLVLGNKKKSNGGDALLWSKNRDTIKVTEDYTNMRKNGTLS